MTIIILQCSHIVIASRSSASVTVFVSFCVDISGTYILNYIFRCNSIDTGCHSALRKINPSSIGKKIHYLLLQNFNGISANSEKSVYYPQDSVQRCDKY